MFGFEPAVCCLLVLISTTAKILLLNQGFYSDKLLYQNIANQVTRLKLKVARHSVFDDDLR